MSNIAVNEEGDIAVVDGALGIVSGIDELTQLIDQTLSASQGDWFLDIDLGIPNFQVILKKSTSIAQIESIYLDTINAIPGILEIETFNLSLDSATRVLSISFRARTTDGVLDYNLNQDRG